MMFFAAGGDALAGGGDAGAGAGADVGGYGDLGGEEFDAGDGGSDQDDSGGDADTGNADDGANDGAQDDAARAAAADKQKAKINEDPDAKDFTAIVDSRVRNMVKAAPELAAIFKAHPEIQNTIYANFRERAAYKEVFPTIAEARQIRDVFPNGIADVQALQGDVQELETLDRSFYTPDANGQYPGHTQILGDMFTEDPAAAVAFMRTVPKEWHRRDPDSYNEVMGQIVGATVNSRQWQARLKEVRDFVAGGGDVKQAAAAIEKIERELLGYTQGKAEPTEAERNLQDRERAFKTQTATQQQQESKRFHQTFLGESTKLQTQIIKSHRAVARLEKLVKSKAMTQEKYDKIVSEIRTRTERFLGKSPSFMRKLRPAHSSRNLQETINLQKAAWSQPWLLNRMVRAVLQVESPALIAQNRSSQRRAGTQQPQTRQPVKGQQQRPTQRTTNFQEGGRWYRPNGSPFTTSEVVAGKHLA